MYGLTLWYVDFNHLWHCLLLYAVLDQFAFLCCTLPTSVLLQAQLDSDGTVSLMSARRPNHYAGCVDDALKAVLVAEGEVLPPCTKFVARKVEA